MRRMFTSATVKLTAWYLINLIVICLLFSFIIFRLSTSEISSRLERLQIRVEGSSQTFTLPGPVTLNEVRKNQTEEAKASIFVGLVYMNVVVVALGGFGSYILARRTLRPIEEAHEAQSRFTSDASHELRTPLAVIKSEIQVALKDPAMKPREYRELLQSNLEEVDRLTELSQSLLQLSRLEYGDVSHYDRIDVVRILRRAAKSVNLAEPRLRVQAPAQNVYIDGNEPIIGDLLRILLENAIKYSTPDSPVEVAVSNDGRIARIDISNDGPGIETKDTSKIFDRFFRTEKSRSSSQIAGYGLGLSIAHRIVSLHDGTISVVSTPGKITTFTVKLPQVRKNR